MAEVEEEGHEEEGGLVLGEALASLLKAQSKVDAASYQTTRISRTALLLPRSLHTLPMTLSLMPPSFFATDP